jgi:ParB family transcriptional regulator, chromosome partitioning protein
MTQFEIIAIKDIFIPERLRAVEEEHALVIAQSIVEHGLINPISVRRTPAQKGGKFTLIAGAHRLRAFEINDESEIEALIFEADQSEGQLIEITENLFRNELSVIDRAVFVQSYREIWEAKYGKIEAGRPGNRVNITQLIGEEAAEGFGKHVANRMGISTEALKLLNRIAQNITPDLRAALRGTNVSDNQAALLKLAKLQPSKQREFATGFRESGDFDLTMKALIGGKPKPDAQAVLLGRLLDTWRRASRETKLEFSGHVREFLEGETAE